MLWVGGVLPNMSEYDEEDLGASCGPAKTAEFLHRHSDGLAADEILAAHGVTRPLNPVQERCLATLVLGTAGDELRKAAVMMLKNGGLTSAQLKAANAAKNAAAAAAAADAAPAARGWKCPQCTLQNATAALVCTACAHARKRKASGWECPQCTLANAVSASRCKACDAPKPKRPRAAQADPCRNDVDMDDEDDDLDAFR